jgi:hypothetical protein
VAAAGQISPELVLVCPELAERARAALPDRPWEAFLPRVPAGPGEWASPRVAPVDGWGPARLLSLLPAALLAGFVAVVIAGSLPWLGERPTLGPPQPRVQLRPANAAPPSYTPRAQEVSGPRLIAPSQRHARPRP